MELKPLPSHLRYAYLDDEENLPVIVSAQLDEDQLGKLLTALRTHRKALGWTVTDLVGISPQLCIEY